MNMAEPESMLTPGERGVLGGVVGILIGLAPFAWYALGVAAGVSSVLAVLVALLAMRAVGLLREVRALEAAAPNQDPPSAYASGRAEWPQGPPPTLEEILGDG